MSTADGALRRPLGITGLEVYPLALGGNVFGWTADERSSFAVLDAYVEAGGNFIDTADEYSCWVPGNPGGVSETIIGRWMSSRNNRDDIVLATKVGLLDGLRGLAPATIRTAIEGSLRRLGVDHVDLYYAHRDDPDTPQDESLAVFAELVREGKVRHLAASSFSADRLGEALEISAAHGWPAYEVLQPHFNLIARSEYEGPLADLCAARGVACVPHSGLAQGLLTGKYRSGAPPSTSPRLDEIQQMYASPRADAIIEVLAAVAEQHAVPLAAVALAWLMAQPTVVAPLASARSPEQLEALVRSVDLSLSRSDLDRLGRASCATAAESQTS